MLRQFWMSSVSLPLPAKICLGAWHINIPVCLLLEVTEPLGLDMAVGKEDVGSALVLCPSAVERRTAGRQNDGGNVARVDDILSFEKCIELLINLPVSQPFAKLGSAFDKRIKVSRARDSALCRDLCGLHVIRKIRAIVRHQALWNVRGRAPKYPPGLVPIATRHATGNRICEVAYRDQRPSVRR